MQSTGLNEHGCHGTATLVESSRWYRERPYPGWHADQVQRPRSVARLQQLVDIGALLGGNAADEHGVATVLFPNEVTR